MLHGLLLLGVMLVGQTETPPADDLNIEVRQLVRQLDADSLDRRDAAEAELLRRGTPVLDLLPTPNDRMSAEVKQRLGRVRQKLQQQAADAAAQSTTITLHAGAMPLQKALAEFQKQSGNKLVDHRKAFGQPATDVIINAQFDKTPFWQALDDMLDHAMLTVYPFAEGTAIHVVASPERYSTRRAHAGYSGLFRFEPVGVVARREVRGGTGSLRVQIEAAWEPRLHIIAMSQRMADVKAIDERGRPVPVANRNAQPEISTSGTAAALRFDIPFELPRRDVLRIASLKSKLTAMIPGRMETFRFDKLTEAKDVGKRIAGVTVTLEQVRKNNDAWEVRMLVKFDDAGDALASHRTWIFNNPAYLEGADGKPIAYESYETTRQTKNEVGIAYVFAPDMPFDKLTFVYKTPGTIVSRSFEYEVKDIELP